MEPYYKNDLTTIYNGDCLEVMDYLIEQDVKVDMILTSPPYDDLRTYDNTLEWDFDIFKIVAKECFEILCDGGIMIWVVGDRTINGSESGTSFKQALYFKEIGFNLHDTMIYQKNNYMPLNHNRYDQAFEYMFVLTKGKPKTFNPIKIPCLTAGASYNYATRSSSSSKEKNGALRTRDKKMITNEYKYRNNIWGYNIGKYKGTNDDVWEHPATFPDKLAEEHILSWSNKDDLILDMFAGSCTTLKMAEIFKRRSIGIEKVTKYCDIGIKRLSQLQMRLEI